MTTLFDRALRVQVQDRVLEGLAVEFRIDRSLSDKPNTADLTIYNLSADNRAFLQELQRPIVQINAGYRGTDPTEATNQPTVSGANTDLPLVFLGELREVTNLREGTDWITRITTGDGDEALKSPVEFSLGPGASLQTAIEQTITSMGVGIGNAISALKKGQFAEAGKQFVNGFVAQGTGGKELPRLMKSAGLEMSVQNGEVQAMPIGQPVNNTAVLLSAASGLIGSPEFGLDKKTNKPTVKFRSLLTARIFPGCRLKIESMAINGFVRVNRCVYHGQSHGNEWYVDGEATVLT